MDLSYDFYINAPIEKVWETLVSDEGVQQTFYGCTIRSSFIPGETISYIGPGNDGEETVHVYGKILTCNPLEKLSFTEHPGPSYNQDHANLETRITYTLTTVGNCTKLTLINDLWSQEHPSYKSTKDHWPMILSNIKTFTETGKQLDFGF
ncbi:SRPBCC domain-containing protein [Gracilibacillus dipsosauri]|uniref:Polyketide cyclase n=1 Tax=Gracilibacillus dipsosauri TaxID=178340 RepID=A0A317KU97_9BACI|nr:SRPBCC domain-containing protein [Gracilibacillus dipsosauri]PWU66853.1 polyketide cyclase [Gracilibacillus dipsosauri]